MLLYNLMKTVKQVLPGAHVVNVSGPDYLHEILGKVGLAPTVGVGNVSLFEPMLKAVVAEKRGTRPEAVDITLVGHTACACRFSRRERWLPASPII